MSNARNNILMRLRGSRSKIPPAARITQEETTPTWSVEARIELFKTRLEAVRAEVHVTTTNEWTGKLHALSRDKGLKQLLYAPGGPHGAEIERGWPADNEGPRLITRDQPVATWKEELFFEIGGAVTSVRAGIAETGTLVLWPDAAEPRSLSLVPPVHFAILRVESLYSTFQELIETEQWRQGLPTNALLVSGPSKSADIEQTLAYGIHGPVELIVILVVD